jgi:hypothetical protein
MRPAEFGREPLQPIQPSRGQHQIPASRGELTGEVRPDAGGGSGYQCGFLGHCGDPVRQGNHDVVLRFTFYVLRFTLLRFTFYVLRFTFYVLRFTFYVLRSRSSALQVIGVHSVPLILSLLSLLLLLRKT